MGDSKEIKRNKTARISTGSKIHRKLSNFLHPDKSDSKFPGSPLEGENVKEMVNNFVDHTGITLVAYVGTRNGFGWKLIWLAVIAAGFTMTIIQSNDAIHDYFGYAIILRTTFELNGTMQFPAVTICSNTPINWTQERNMNSTIYQEIVAKLNDEDAKHVYGKETTRKSRSYEEYVLLETLNKYYTDIVTMNNNTNYGVLTKLYWNGEIYTNKKSSQNKVLRMLEDEGILYQMHDYLFGDCVVFNAEIDLEKTLSASALTGAEFTLQWDIKDRYPYINDPSTVVVIHPVGTPPIFDDSNNIKINPGDEITIAIQQREISRLPPPFPSRCVDKTNPTLQSNSVYYQYDRPYLVSMEACIKTCMQKISLDSCRCFDAQIPLGFLRKKYKRTPLCKMDRCSQIDKKLTSKFCRCKLPCKESLLESTLTVKSGFLKEIAKRTLADNETTESIESLSQQSENNAKLKVFIKSAVYESIREEPKYTVADFWGIIGGNAGLWIGISAVSLFEVVELICVVIKAELMKLCGKKPEVGIINSEDVKAEVLRRIEQGHFPSHVQIKTYKYLPEL